jgi:hypothetical protein
MRGRQLWTKTSCRAGGKIGHTQGWRAGRRAEKLPRGRVGRRKFPTQGRRASAPPQTRVHHSPHHLRLGHATILIYAVDEYSASHRRLHVPPGSTPTKDFHQDRAGFVTIKSPQSQGHWNLSFTPKRRCVVTTLFASSHIGHQQSFFRRHMYITKNTMSDASPLATVHGLHSLVVPRRTGQPTTPPTGIPNQWVFSHK